jgi:transposase
MYYCGIDVAKRKQAIAILDEKGQLVQRPFTIENTRAGFDQLLQALAILDGPVLIGLEATGHYWWALYDELTQHAYPVVVLNALQVHAFRKSGVRKVKSDRTDAVWIAEFLRFSQPEPAKPTTAVFLQLKDLSRFRYHLSDQIGDAKRKLLSVLDRVFPEYETLFSSVFLTTSRQLLAQAASAQELADFDLQELTELLHTASRGRFDHARAEALQTLARQSVGVRFLADAAQLQVRCLLAQIDLLEEQRHLVDDALAQLMAQVPQHLTSIPGVGPTTGAALLAEIGDIQRFDAPEKLVAYAGIDATVYQTGQFEARQMHMSKRGSPYLRHALWQAASMAIMHDAELRAYYDRKRQEGKAHGTALGAVCRKLLTRVYIVLKENRPYETRTKRLFLRFDLLTSNSRSSRREMPFSLPER